MEFLDLICLKLKVESFLITRCQNGFLSNCSQNIAPQCKQTAITDNRNSSFQVFFFDACNAINDYECPDIVKTQLKILNCFFCQKEKFPSWDWH